MFFIISGFLAFATYKQEGVCYYWWKRAVRLLPLYYCIVVYNFIVHTFVYKDVPILYKRITSYKRLIVFMAGIYFLDKYSYTIYLVQGLVFDVIIDRHSMLYFQELEINYV